MKNILKFLTLILILISLTSFGQEKLGHINSQNLIDLMPDSKKATDELAEFEKELQDEYTRLTTQFEKKYTEFQQKESSMSDVQLQNEYAELQEFQQRILEFEQSMQAQYQSKFMELLTPIQKKANDAIESVGKENGYIYIFDDASILYASPKSEDVLPLVKKKLGL